MLDLFAGEPPWQEELVPGAIIYRRRVRAAAEDILAAMHNVARQAPFRHLVTPGGYTMSVAMTNCGPLGWVSSRRGYRYECCDPLTGKPWPAMPEDWSILATTIARETGYDGFKPDACLINRYQTGSKMALHQDKDEQEARAPIVSFSLGVAAVFQFGGLRREDSPRRILLEHGDVVVWGGAARFNFHGILPLKAAAHPLTGSDRYNLTFRRVVKDE